MLFLHFIDEEIEAERSRVCCLTSHNPMGKRWYVSLGLFFHYNRLQENVGFEVGVPREKRGERRRKTCLLGGKNKPRRKWETQECTSLMFILKTCRVCLKLPFDKPSDKRKDFRVSKCLPF